MTPCKAFLTSKEIRSLAQRSDLWGAALLLHCWAVILWWPNVVTFAVAIMVIGSRQLGRAILMHEVAHTALFRTRRLIEFAGVWLCGAPVLADLASYRHYHPVHHRLTQTDKDPDLRLSKPFPTIPASPRRKLIRDITGQADKMTLARGYAEVLRTAASRPA